MTSRFAGRTAMVTGGASGIGEHVVRQIAAAGGAVVVVDRDHERTRQLVTDLSTEGATVRGYPADLVDPEQAAAAVDFAVGEFGALHLAVNNAGINGRRAKLGDYDLDQWNRIMDVNLGGVFHCLRAQLPAITAAGGGSVVNVASIFGLVGDTGNAAYTASKHAVVGLTKTAALDYAQDGVRVNCVAPGYVDTPLLLGYDADKMQATASRHPVGRMATPQEIANVVTFLLSDDASFVTGACLAADGGFVAR